MIKESNFPSLVFFGTPTFASYCLKALLEKDFPVLAVVTAPDRKAGRGKKLKASAVKALAQEYGLPILQPANLKDPKFVTQLAVLKAKIFIVVAFRMLPRLVWEIPPLGTVNLHASLLPNYRGAAPINWVLIHGEVKTGVTTFLINEQIDTGAILLQKEVAIESSENAGSLHDKLLQAGAPLIIETIKNLAKGSIISKTQQLIGEEHEAPKLSSENTQLDWKLPLEKLRNKIRGLNPSPGAWSFFENNRKQERLKLFDVEIVYKSHTHPIGKILVESDKIFIANSEGLLSCLEIQLPNKKRMSAKALLNGYKFDVKARVL